MQWGGTVYIWELEVSHEITELLDGLASFIYGSNLCLI
jgi:hypothetical protein